jgi:hypothetical protein
MRTIWSYWMDKAKGKQQMRFGYARRGSSLTVGRS